MTINGHKQQTANADHLSPISSRKLHAAFRVAPMQDRMRSDDEVGAD